MSDLFPRVTIADEATLRVFIGKLQAAGVVGREKDASILIDAEENSYREVTDRHRRAGIILRDGLDKP